MKRLITLSAVLALFLGNTLCTFADDDDKGKGKGKRPFGSPEATFKKLDTNNDGKLSKEEFSKIRDNIPQKIKDKTAGKTNGKLGDKLFDLLDENKDGTLSLDEFKKMREKMTERLKKAKQKTSK